MRRADPRFAALLLAALLIPSRLAAAPPAAASRGAAPVASQAAAPARSVTPGLDIKEIRLDNGLRIFVLERSASPTFTGIYQFGVGGAMDPRGRTGIAHLLEHMMFKGTRTLDALDYAKEAPLISRISEVWHELQAEKDRQEDPFSKADTSKIEDLKKEIEKLSAEEKSLIAKGEFDEVMSRAGAVGENAETGNDSTRYFMALPANRLELWFRMESDRLLEPVFREFYSERDVVHEERRESTEDTPFGLISEAMDSLMYPAHPYGQPVVGWPSDIEHLGMEDALAYFTTYYSPSNCLMAIVGDVSAAEVERLARKYLGSWKRQELPRLQITEEPPPRGERRRIVEFDAEPELMVAWPAVRRGHADEYPLTILGTVLGALASSRLDKTAVQEERIAESVFSGYDFLRYAGRIVAGGTPSEGHTAAELEADIDREVKKIQSGGVTPEEMERSKIRTEVSRVRRLKSNFGQALDIIDAVAASGGTDYLRTYEERLDAVTADQVKEVAARYITPSRKCVVEIRKTPGAGGGPEGGGAEVAHQHGGAPGARGAAHSSGFAEAMEMIRRAPPVALKVPRMGADFDRAVLPSGITVFIAEDHTAPSISMSFRWLGGSNTTPVEGLAPFELATQLLNEGGTESLDPIALSEREEDLGMAFSYSIGGNESYGTFWSLKRNFDDAFALALDILMKPRLDEKRLTTIKGQYVDQKKREGEIPSLGASLMEKHVLDSDHPRLGYVASRQEVESVTADQIRAAWKRYLGRDNLYVTVVGDFDRKAMLDLLEERLGRWRKAEDRKRVFITRDPVTRPGVYLYEKDLPQPAVEITHQIKVDRSAPEADHAAIEILDAILGGSGFRSRLMERLRSDEGLTYGVYSSLAHEGRRGQAGALTISYQTRRSTVARSIQDVMEEVRKIIREDVSQAEVDEQIDAWSNSFVFQFQSLAYSLTRLMDNELDDRPHDFDRSRLESIRKVTVADVRRAAEKYLRPDAVTIAIFGSLPPEDRAALEKAYGLKVLTKDQIFKGGYLEDRKKGA